MHVINSRAQNTDNKSSLPLQRSSQPSPTLVGGFDFSQTPIHAKNAGPSDPFINLKESYASKRYFDANAIVRENKGNGIPLSSDILTSLKKNFGVDFSKVKVHTDTFADNAVRAIDANAFTLGQDIFFRPDKFSLGQADGKVRFVHEIIHTAQQRGSTVPSAASMDVLEEKAQELLCGDPSYNLVAPSIQREPTFPRRATGHQMIREAERILTTSRDVNSSDETVRMWSSVSTNFQGSITTGSLARRVWTYLFLRHFTEAESRPGVESSHPRYFFSHTYGWIDAQHFFGFIDFAEEDYISKGNNRQQGFAESTSRSIGIEERQQKIRDYLVIMQESDFNNTTRLMEIRPPNTPLFRLPPAAAATAARMAAMAASQFLLSGTQRELFNMLNSQQREKFWIDSAKSAFTTEDIVSNQLGIRFFYLHGSRINGMPEASREVAFRAALNSFFASIHVENDQAEVDRLARESGLPMRERFQAPKTTEEKERRSHPELFAPPP